MANIEAELNVLCVFHIRVVFEFHEVALLCLCGRFIRTMIDAKYIVARITFSAWLLASTTLTSVSLTQALVPLSPFRNKHSPTGQQRHLLVMSSSSVTPSSSTKPKHVVIAGAGVIGTSTAYYLAKNHGIASTLIDPTGQIAPAASGKAAGFLALDMNDHTPVEALARRSFHLHQELADTLGADSIQYRRLTGAVVHVDPFKNTKPKGKKLQGVEWAYKEGKAFGMQSLGNEETIAQVHPKLLCQRLWEQTNKTVTEGGVGSKLQKGKVVGASYESGKLVGAKLDDGTVVTCDALLFACGPWAGNIMFGVKYHSAVLPTDRVLNQCVFFSGCGDPEVYVRPDSTAYCTGFPDPAVRVTERPGEEEVRNETIATILKSVRDASGNSTEGGALGQDPILEQACYLPTTDDGVPVMGMLPAESMGGPDSYIAAGHSCWGILMGPASGESMASLIATGKSKHVDLQPFDPSRYKNITVSQ
jgi:glycine/D-amino acid oxidase-like deaminating enzyme